MNKNSGFTYDELRSVVVQRFNNIDSQVTFDKATHLVAEHFNELHLGDMPNIETLSKFINQELSILRLYEFGTDHIEIEKKLNTLKDYYIIDDHIIFYY